MVISRQIRLRMEVIEKYGGSVPLGTYGKLGYPLEPVRQNLVVQYVVQQPNKDGTNTLQPILSQLPCNML